VSDSLDVSVAVPIVQNHLKVVSEATIHRDRRAARAWLEEQIVRRRGASS